jgi:beta-glucosidase
VSKLTNDEKLQMIKGLSTAGGCIGNIAGIPRLGFPGICLLDGPTVVGRNELVSVFPAGVTVAASWDRNLMYERGHALGQEFKGKGGHVMLG